MILEAPAIAIPFGPRYGPMYSAPFSAAPAISGPCSLITSHPFLAPLDIAEDSPVVAL
jgi:hypothetical protein